MTPASSIQEGGCTTPPPLPPTKLDEANVLPAIALVSPALVVGAAWVTGTTLEDGVQAVSITLRVAALALAMAIAVSGVAVWRAKDRESKVLSVIGLAGNALILVLGAAYLWLR